MCNIKNKIFDMGFKIEDINIDMNPKIIIIPKSGLANILDMKNVNEIGNLPENRIYFIALVICNIVIGIIISCAEKVTLNASAIFCFIFNFIKKFVILLLNITIPAVPMNESFNPISFIANGF